VWRKPQHRDRGIRTHPMGAGPDVKKIELCAIDQSYSL